MAGRYLLEIFGRTGANADRIREELAALRTTSIKGPIAVTEDHDVLPPIGIFTIQGGEKVRLEAAVRLEKAAA